MLGLGLARECCRTSPAGKSAPAFSFTRDARSQAAPAALEGEEPPRPCKRAVSFQLRVHGPPEGNGAPPRSAAAPPLPTLPPPAAPRFTAAASGEPHASGVPPASSDRHAALDNDVLRNTGPQAATPAAPGAPAGAATPLPLQTSPFACVPTIPPTPQLQLQQRSRSSADGFGDALGGAAPLPQPSAHMGDGAAPGQQQAGKEASAGGGGAATRKRRPIRKPRYSKDTAAFALAVLHAHGEDADLLDGAGRRAGSPATLAACAAHPPLQHQQRGQGAREVEAAVPGPAALTSTSGGSSAAAAATATAAACVQQPSGHAAAEQTSGSSSGETTETASVGSFSFVEPRGVAAAAAAMVGGGSVAAAAPPPVPCSSLQEALTRPALLVSLVEQTARASQKPVGQVRETCPGAGEPARMRRRG